MNRKEELKNLYKQAFHDSDKYVDYLFDEVYADSNVRFIESEGEISSALYLIPRQLSYKDRLVPSVFLSAVSTAEKARGRGVMKELMKSLFLELSHKPVGAIFLSPKDERYYLSQGFCTVLQAKKVEFAPVEPFFKLKNVENFEEFHFLNIENSSRSDLFFNRTKSLSKKLFDLTNIEDCAVYKAFEGERYVGYFVLDKEGIFEYSIPVGKLRHVNMENLQWFVFGEGESFTMARIMNPKIFFNDIPCPVGFDVELRVVDNFLNKDINVRLLSEGGRLNCTDGVNPSLTVSIEALTRWAFGLEKIEGLPTLCLKNEAGNFGFYDRYL